MHHNKTNMATEIKPLPPIQVTQGQQAADNSGIVNFDPNTGKSLNTGQTVFVPPVQPSAKTDVLGTSAVMIRPTAPSTTAQGTEQYIGAINNTYKTQRQDEITQQQAIQDSYVNQISDAFNEQAGLGQQREDILQDNGADEAKKQADEYTSQIEAEQLAVRRQIESLEKNNPRGLGRGAMQAEVTRIQNESTSKQADLAILQNAATRKYDTAVAIADRKVKLETEALKTRMESLQFFYQDNKDSLTKKQDQAYQEAITEAERQYTETYESKKMTQEASCYQPKPLLKG